MLLLWVVVVAVTRLFIGVGYANISMTRASNNYLGRVSHDAGGESVQQDREERPCIARQEGVHHQVRPRLPQLLRGQHLDMV